MPGWHDAIRDQYESGEIQVVGIILEQHPDRCRLFMQWKEMDFPILVDSMNLMEAPLVPLSFLIDESGRVVELAGRPRSLDEFLAREPVDWEESPAPSAANLRNLARDADRDSAAAMAHLGAQQLLWGGEALIDEAIDSLAQAAKLEPAKGSFHFRLGVAHRERYEGAERRDSDFADAVEAWEAALATDPNQYIWRRRIQQYGPRLDKPYPFYDWVDEARRAIEARGEAATPLRIEPRGAEIARPAKGGSPDESAENPDPEGRILRDEEGFIRVDSVVVPHTYGDGRAMRIHLEFTPNSSLKAHWNNEGGGLTVWIDPPVGWSASPRTLSVVEADQAVSQAPRSVELDLIPPEGAPPGTTTIPGFALYYVCEDVSGVCLYRRRDLELSVTID